MIINSKTGDMFNIFEEDNKTDMVVFPFNNPYNFIPQCFGLDWYGPIDTFYVVFAYDDKKEMKKFMKFLKKHAGKSNIVILGPLQKYVGVFYRGLPETEDFLNDLTLDVLGRLTDTETC